MNRCDSAEEVLKNEVPVLVQFLIEQTAKLFEPLPIPHLRIDLASDDSRESDPEARPAKPPKGPNWFSPTASPFMTPDRSPEAGRRTIQPSPLSGEDVRDRLSQAVAQGAELFYGRRDSGSSLSSDASLEDLAAPVLSYVPPPPHRDLNLMSSLTSSPMSSPTSAAAPASPAGTPGSPFVAPPRHRKGRLTSVHTVLDPQSPPPTSPVSPLPRSMASNPAPRSPTHRAQGTPPGSPLRKSFSLAEDVESTTDDEFSVVRRSRVLRNTSDSESSLEPLATDDETAPRISKQVIEPISATAVTMRRRSLPPTDMQVPDDCEDDLTSSFV